MLAVHARSLAVGSFVVVIAIVRLAAAQTVSGPYEETIKRALVLLPTPPAQILVVDATQAPRKVDAHGRRVQAFVRYGETVVYLIADGPTLRGAQNGSGIFDYALATLIWHEMAHLGGADEREAPAPGRGTLGAIPGGRPGRHGPRSELSGPAAEAPLNSLRGWVGVRVTSRRRLRGSICRAVSGQSRCEA
jgi:hypothetical protein